MIVLYKIHPTPFLSFTTHNRISHQAKMPLWTPAPFIYHQIDLADRLGESNYSFASCFLFIYAQNPPHTFRSKLGIEPVLLNSAIKADLRRTMAERCSAGEFNGSCWSLRSSLSASLSALPIKQSNTIWTGLTLLKLCPSCKLGTGRDWDSDYVNCNGHETHLRLVERGGSASAAAAVSGSG